MTSSARVILLLLAVSSFIEAQDYFDMDLVIVTDMSPPAIYYARLEPNLRFKKINIDGGRRNITAPADVDYDPVEKRVYWTQWTAKWNGEGCIARCDLNGQFYQVVVRTDYAVGLALDTDARKMYFSHEGMALEVANMDGTNRRTLIRELPRSGLHVFFDGIGKRVYVSDSSRKIIESVKLNGSNRTIHVDGRKGLSHPGDISIDSKAGRIYFVDFGTDRVASTDLFGNRGQILYQYPLVTTDLEPHAIATTLQNEIFWVDRNNDKLYKIPKNPRIGQVIQPRRVGNVRFGWPSGLHIYQTYSKGGILQSSLATAYIMFLTASALLIQPPIGIPISERFTSDKVTYATNATIVTLPGGIVEVLPVNSTTYYVDCKPDAFTTVSVFYEVTIGDLINGGVSALLMLLTVLYACLKTFQVITVNKRTQESDAFEEEVGLCSCWVDRIGPAEREDRRRLRRRNWGLVRNERDGTLYSYALFYLTFVLASFFIMMTLTNGFRPELASLELLNRTPPPFWVKMGSAWACALLYLLKLIYLVCHNPSEDDDDDEDENDEPDPRSNRHEMNRVEGSNGRNRRRPEDEDTDSSFFPGRPPSPVENESEWLWELHTPLGQPTSYFDADNSAYYRNS